MNNPPQGSLASIVKVDEEAFSSFNMFDVFGVSDTEQALNVTKNILSKSIFHPGYAVPASSEKQPWPDGEPEGVLIADPDDRLRSGVVAYVVKVNGDMTLDGASVYFDGGVQHEFELSSITVSKNRIMGVLNGKINGVSLSVFEPTFLSERQWHGAGSIHQIGLYGIPYWVAVGTPDPIEVASQEPDKQGETQILKFDNAAMVMPESDLPASHYQLVGPVKAVSPYPSEVMGQKVTEIKLTIARSGENNDQDIDIALFVPETVLALDAMPQVGEMLQARAQLCSRLFVANIAK